MSHNLLGRPQQASLLDADARLVAKGEAEISPTHKTGVFYLTDASQKSLDKIPLLASILQLSGGLGYYLKTEKAICHCQNPTDKGPHLHLTIEPME